MPSMESSAATKCISDVPGLAKQTSTPQLTRVRISDCAPFISVLMSLPPCCCDLDRAHPRLHAWQGGEGEDTVQHAVAGLHERQGVRATARRRALVLMAWSMSGSGP